MKTLLMSLLLILAAATPLLAKSVGQAAIQHNKEEDVLEAGDLALVTSREDEAAINRARASVPSLPEKFLQIAHKSCQGPKGQPGTCMFNFKCQQQRGQVVGACLDGFLFGACCHLSTDQSINAALASALQVVGVAASSNKSDSIIINQQPADMVASPAENVGVIDSTDLLGLRVPTQPSPDEMMAQLPLVLMFRNESNGAIKLASGSNSSVEEVSSEPSLRVVTESGVPWNGEVSLAITALADNQISLSLPAKPTTAGSVLHDKGDVDIQAQLSALLQAHTESTTVPFRSSTVANRVPVRNKGQLNKRPRPKLTTTKATTTTTTTTTTAPAPADEENPVNEKEYNSAEEIHSSVTESLADQQANLLQFLVSNPPSWVLDEIINGSTLTTWYPLPISEDIPEALADSAEVSSLSSTVSTTPVTRPLKRKPVKNRVSSTTAPSLMEDGDSADASSSTESTTTTTTTTTTTRKPRPIYDYTKDCGVRPMAPEARIVGGRRSDYGRWPWQVLIRESTWFGIFSKNKCGGVLISDRHVLTAAHCQPGFLGSLLVVLGEFDLTGHSEPNTPVEKNVKRVVVHRDYVERTFENDLAILELESPVDFKPYIVPICLPSTSEGDFVGKKAEVTGWGKLSHNGPTPGVLYEVDVPIMSNPECHDMFKKAGHEKRILDSFVCAGYSEGKKDSCEGDSGGPLMLEREDGRWSLVGTVSHGIRCAYPNMPGVYMRMTYYRPWIERVTGIGGTMLGR